MRGARLMTLDWTSFTPYASALGGAMIGAAAAILVLFTGRIAGVSGILGGLLRPQPGGVSWRVAFLLGIVAAPALYAIAAPLPPIAIDTPTATLALAGALVGIGTRYGAGCTSGHGICGVSRLSMRSIVATACFLATGFATVFVVRHLLA